jgi:hypothetical protein
MNPEELKKQGEEEGPSTVVDEEGPEILGDSPMQAGAQTVKEPETKQPSEEPEVRQAPPEDDPQQEEILQGLQIEITSTGDVKRNFYGTSQNVTLMLGLAETLKMEVETRQKLQRGFMPSAELTAMGGLARLMQNMGSVMVQIQGAMMAINETMKAGFDEAGQVESTVDAESKQE